MNLPDNAKKVFKGAIFDVYQWEQELYDGSTATFEGLKRPSTIQVIPTKGDKVYLSFEEQPIIKSPSHAFLGGRQEAGEDPLECAKRELLEESGLQSHDWELFKIYKFDGKIDWSIYLYIARNCEKVAEPHLDAGEKIEVREVSFEEFMDITTDEKFWAQLIINDFLRMKLDPQKLEAFRRKLFIQK
jgi:ADP-ribose pyrophosphatase